MNRAHILAGSVMESVAVAYGVSLYAVCLYCRVRWGRL